MLEFLLDLVVSSSDSEADVGVKLGFIILIVGCVLFGALLAGVFALIVHVFFK